ncbi:SAM-dependent methyltransferase [[Mycobacterium] nativiensis]|uniref:S-adenosyl-L-methionine-dependent methyltransferase n=1 Tax=[Mycobacterium] nativiensis TaxID=2855503 RepID=A0ABU5Y2S6_9MYCO|nr:SAM-dependent methyltransferase [Mycolicibacter sp. MYC340]MEB3034026.1 SAM-dependent methyltransferase [Mycolicibacter sp. MYC340]
MGLTATETAAARAVATCRSSPLIKDLFAATLVRAVGDEFFIGLAEQRDSHDETRFAIPRLVDWIAARTKFFDDYLMAATDAGIRQVVILGAGLDARSYRTEWPVDTTVYEVDQPGVTDFKTAVMAQMSAKPRALRRPVAADLIGEWVTPLLRCGYDRSLPTVWIAEGLLPYLPPPTQRMLLNNIARISVSGSRFAADTADDKGLTELIASAMAHSARPAGSTVNLAVGSGTAPPTRSELSELLGEHGWLATQFAASDLFVRYGLPATDDDIYHRIVFVTAAVS